MIISWMHWTVMTSYSIKFSDSLGATCNLPFVPDRHLLCSEKKCQHPRRRTACTVHVLCFLRNRQLKTNGGSLISVVARREPWGDFLPICQETISREESRVLIGCFLNTENIGAPRTRGSKEKNPEGEVNEWDSTQIRKSTDNSAPSTPDGHVLER